MRDAREPDAAGALKLAWGIDATPGPPHRGISRLTWQIGAVGWLARESASRLDETRAEAGLLALLAANAAFAVPLPISTRQSQPVARIGDFTWTLCRHIEGERLGDAPASYRRLVAMLTVVHRVLRGIDARHAVRQESLLSRARNALQAESRALAPATHMASAWLRERIAVLDALPTQLIHGDFGLPNVLVDAEEPERFGILDWELSSCDSPIFDLAQIAFGMIAFSHTSPSRAQIATLTRRYAEHGGQSFSEDQLMAALVAGRLAHIMWLHERLTGGETMLVESVRFLDERLARTLRWLNHHY